MVRTNVGGRGQFRLGNYKACRSMVVDRFLIARSVVRDPTTSSQSYSQGICIGEERWGLRVVAKSDTHLKLLSRARLVCTDCSGFTRQKVMWCRQKIKCLTLFLRRCNERSRNTARAHLLVVQVAAVTFSSCFLVAGTTDCSENTSYSSNYGDAKLKPPRIHYHGSRPRHGIPAMGFRISYFFTGMICEHTEVVTGRLAFMRGGLNALVLRNREAGGHSALRIARHHQAPTFTQSSPHPFFRLSNVRKSTHSLDQNQTKCTQSLAPTCYCSLMINVVTFFLIAPRPRICLGRITSPCSTTVYAYNSHRNAQHQGTD